MSGAGTAIISSSPICCAGSCARTQPDLIPLLHRRASLWFDAHDDPVEAIWQAIHGADWQRARDLIERTNGRSSTGARARRCYN